MQKGSTQFLKLAIFLMVISGAALMVWLPQLGTNSVQFNFMQVYTDPVVVYAYFASIPFFVGLYQALKMLRYIESDTFFSKKSLTAARKIKYSAFSVPVLITIGQIVVLMNGKVSYLTGFVAVGVYVTFASIVLATIVAVCERLLQSAVEMKLENDLTV